MGRQDEANEVLDLLHEFAREGGEVMFLELADSCRARVRSVARGAEHGGPSPFSELGNRRAAADRALALGILRG